MLTVTVDSNQMRALKAALEGTKKKLPKELANAINKTATKTRTNVGRKVRAELAISVKDMKRFLRVRGRANPRRLGASVELDHQKRPGIGGPTGRFKPKQTARGTSFKVGKKQRRQTIKGAFMGPRPGVLAPKLYGGVFKRTGPRRTPIVKLHGASPWAAYVQNNLDPIIRRETRRELRRQIDSRIRTILKQKRLSR